MDNNQEFTRELCEAMVDLMCRWSPHSYYADYECALCGERTKTNYDEPVHLPDCLGLKCQKWLADNDE
jgi:hypothetical protein